MGEWGSSDVIPPLKRTRKLQRGVECGVPMSGAHVPPRPPSMPCSAIGYMTPLNSSDQSRLVPQFLASQPLVREISDSGISCAATLNTQLPQPSPGATSRLPSLHILLRAPSPVAGRASLPVIIYCAALVNVTGSTSQARPSGNTPQHQAQHSLRTDPSQHMGMPRPLSRRCHDRPYHSPWPWSGATSGREASW